MMKLKHNSSILITGAGGGLGKTVFAYLERKDFTNLLVPDRKEMDLLNQESINKYLSFYRPKVIIHSISIKDGLEQTYNWYAANVKGARQ